MAEYQNRAFMYGESVFTTTRIVNGRLMDWEHHFERLRKGVEFVYGPFTDGDEWVAIFKNFLENKSHTDEGDKVIRFTVYREQVRGLMRSSLISITDLKIHVSTSVYERPQQQKSLKLRTCTVKERPDWWPSYLKAGSYLETILAQKICLKDDDDDLLFLSKEGTVLESSVANIFVVRHNKLYTAPVGPNVLDGIMRKKVIEVARNYFDDVIISGTDVDQLYKADAIFGSNSVRGLFLVDRVDNYELTYNQEFMMKFEQLRNRIFE